MEVITAASRVCCGRNVPPPTDRVYRRWRASLALAAGVITGGAATTMMLLTSPDRGPALIVEPDGARGPVTVEAWTGSGAGDEEPGAAGLAHLAEHVALAHAEQVAGARLTAAGGALDGWVTPDATVFRAVVPDAASLATALAAIDHALAADPGDALAPLLDRERRAIAAEPAPPPLARVLLAAVWPGRALPSTGAVAAAAPHAVARFWRRSYRPARTTLVVRGAAVDAVQRAHAPTWRTRRPAPAWRPHPPERAVTAVAAPAVAAAPPGRWAIGLPVGRLVSAAAAELAVAAALAAGCTPWLDANLDSVELILLAGGGVLALTGRGVAPARPAVAAALRALGAASPPALAAARARVGCPIPGVRGRASELAVGHHLAGDVDWVARFHARVAQVGAADVGRALGALDPGRAVRITDERRPPVRRARRAPPPPAPARPAPRARPVAPTRATLASGVRVVAARVPGASRVAIRVAWPGGFARDPVDARATTALLAAVLPSACGAGDVAAVVDGLDGELAGIAGRWSLGLRSTWPSTAWQDGLAVVTNCLTAPRFPAEAIARERERLRALATGVAGSPARAGFGAYLAARWGAHPLGRQPLTAAGDLDALAGEDLARVFAERHPPGAAVIAVVGDVDPAAAIAAVRARVDGARVPARRASPPPPAAPPAPASTPRQVFVDGPADATAVVIGLPGLAATDADRAALDVLAAILDGPRGRLATALGPGAVRAVAVTAADAPDAGYLAIELDGAPPTDVHLDAVRAALDTLVAAGPTDAEVTAALAALAPAATPAARADDLAIAELTGLDRGAARAAVGRAAVRRVAARVLRWDDALVVTVRPPDSTPGVRRQQQRAPARRRPARARPGRRS